MFAAHLAAGLAVKSVAPKAPTWAVLTGAFLPDLFWIGFAAMGVEPANDAAFFDGWSHSAASITIQALLFALCFFRLGPRVMIAVGVAVFSHLLLDAPVHPKPLELYPHASLTLGWESWRWGQTPFALGKSHYWWLQFAVTVPLLMTYAVRARRGLVTSNLIAASCLIVLGLELAL